MATQSPLVRSTGSPIGTSLIMSISMALLLSVPMGNARAQAAAALPTVAVLDFTNGAVSKTDYSPLTKGLAEMLITELGANKNIRVVERARLASVLEEQGLSSSGQVAQETMIKAGKITGAQHMLIGTFVIDTRNRLRMDVRSVNSETTEREYSTSVSGKADDVLELLVQLAEKLNSGLKLPVPQQGFEGGKAVGAAGSNQFRSLLLIGRALEQQDQKNNTQAIALYKEAVAANPDNQRAKTLLASLEREVK